METSLINRPAYLDFLNRHRDKPIIKVLSGVRRAGKSSLFLLFQQQLRAEGINDDHIITINFEDLQYFDLRDYKKLYDYLTNQMKDDGKYYIFLDEIQHVEKFHLAIDSLFIKPNVDLYITGSNAYFMSGDLATDLTGRYVEKEVQPLSFAEYYSWASEAEGSGGDKTKVFNDYLFSGFPYLINTSSYTERIEYLRGIYNSILLNDIVPRSGSADPTLIERIIRTLLSSVGSIVSANKIRHTLESQGVSIAYATLNKIIDSLADSLLFYAVPRYDVKGRALLQRLEKYYVSDLGFRNLLLPDHQEDFGLTLENLVYLELRRRYTKVYVGNIDKYEVDFVAISDGGGCEYYQVSESTLDSATLARELRSLQLIPDNYPKYLLTLDTIQPSANYDGIQKMNAIEWLLGGK
jgi:predicted AAA+ superfamily ATPase